MVFDCEVEGNFLYGLQGDQVKSPRYGFVLCLADRNEPAGIPGSSGLTSGRIQNRCSRQETFPYLVPAIVSHPLEQNPGVALGECGCAIRSHYG